MPYPDESAESDDEVRARKHKAYLIAQKEYLLAAGWVPVVLVIPHSESLHSTTAELTMWVKEHELKNKKIHTAISTRLALEQQEEFDGYFD